MRGYRRDVTSSPRMLISPDVVGARHVVPAYRRCYVRDWLASHVHQRRHPERSSADGLHIILKLGDARNAVEGSAFELRPIGTALAAARICPAHPLPFLFRQPT